MEILTHTQGDMTVL